MTLDEAVRAFEADFEVSDVTGFESEKKVTDYGRAPSGDTYVILTSGGIKPENQPNAAFFVDESDAIEHWLRQAWIYAENRGGKSLFWRTRPVFQAREYVAVDQAAVMQDAMRRADMNIRIGSVYSVLVVTEAPKKP